jgi:ABC-type multidrug transport system ATPase subunit
MFLLYFVAYMSTLTYAPPTKVDSYVNIVHFTIALISPMANLTRAMFVSLKLFGLVCRDRSIASYPGEMTLYGGPILYLFVQSACLFAFLLWFDSGFSFPHLGRKAYRSQDPEEADALDDEIAAEVRRVNASADDGLRVLHLTKTFGRNVAVEDVTFGVRRGEVFALLGPNGAGKSTTISLIRGDIRPSDNRGEVFIENVPISKRRATARNSLGVCPQIDACDQMTVVEHLRFYARIRGVADVDHNTRKVISAVGLEMFANRMAAALSGGNKRKLSLAIALMGNPSVLLLDEPSSGMDVCAKRVMWQTLASVVPGRSLVLTTHSMEEADALATRAGIMGRKMLALGTTDYLRRKHGDRYHVHLITTTAPHTPPKEMKRIRDWVIANLEDAIIEDRTYHGQLRFSVPAHFKPTRSAAIPFGTDDIRADNTSGVHPASSLSGIGALFTILESQKQALGFEFYSVSPTTLDQVFLTIVRKHNIEEENSREEDGKPGLWQRLTRRGAKGGGARAQPVTGFSVLLT